MQTSLKLFSHILKRVPQIHQRSQAITMNLLGVYDIYGLQQRAKMLYLSQRIYEHVAELQEPIPLSLIERFNANYDSLQFDFDRQAWKFTKRDKSMSISYEISNIFIQRFDHPFFRQTLYFNELKDADKYLTIKSPHYLPKYIKDVHYQMAMQEVIDKKNPMGVPHWAKPLKLQIWISSLKQNAEGGESEDCGFVIEEKLGETKLVKMQQKVDGTKRLIDPYYIDDQMQKAIHKLLEVKAGVSIEELKQMHKLAYVGGALSRVQLLMDLFMSISDQIIQN